MCDCLLSIKAKLKDKVQQDNPLWTEVNVIFMNTGIMMSGCSVQTAPLKITANVPRKNGGFSTKTKKTTMVFSYCPYCGEKL